MRSCAFTSTLCAFVLLAGCGVSNKQVIRMQKMEEKVGSPTTITELSDAIEKYKERVADIQLAQSQIGIWYKILGSRYMDKKMYGEALKTFQAAIDYYPDNQNLFYYVGICAGYMAHAALDYDATGTSSKRMNYLKLAESAYLRAIAIEERYARALYAIGVLYIYELNESEKAIPYLERFVAIETRDTDGMMLLARAYYSNYEFDKAIELYDKIIAISKSAQKRAEAAANKKIVLDASFGN